MFSTALTNLSDYQTARNWESCLLSARLEWGGGVRTRAPTTYPGEGGEGETVPTRVPSPALMCHPKLEAAQGCSIVGSATITWWHRSLCSH